MSFALGAPGIVKVVNESYGEDERRDHMYLVNVREGAAAGCTCPAFDKYPGDCKHMLAVEANEAVLEAGSASADDVREAREREVDVDPAAEEPLFDIEREGDLEREAREAREGR